jgi:subtilisin family serine protease
MKRFAVIVIVALAGLLGFGPGSRTLALAPPPISAKVGAAVYPSFRGAPRVRVIVALREPTTPVQALAERMAEVEAQQGNVLERLAAADFRLTHRWDTISAVAGDATPLGLAALASDPDVLRIDLDEPVFAATAESVSLMRADELLNQGVTGRGVVVAILDTGVERSHPDLASSIVDEHCFCAGCCPGGASEAAGPGSAPDDNGHGTNVTGIVTSDGRVAPRGIAPDADIVALKVLDAAGAGTTTSILSGFDYVLKSRPEVKVVNLSLGSATLFPGTCDGAASFTTALAQAINALKARGTLTFASTLNSGSASAIGVPACIASAVAVGAVYDANGGTVSFGCVDATSRRDEVACFSNSSSKVELLAPGAPITSSGRGSSASTFLGTSQASPHAAAAAALMLSANPGLSPDAIKNALRATGRPITDPKNGIAIPRIDVKAALDSVR